MSGDKYRWRVIGKSVRGASHKRTGLPNQDAIQWLPKSGDELPLLLAVSDGHGSHKCFRSDEGSRLAAKAGADVVYESLTQQSSHSLVKQWAEEKLPREIVRRWRGLVADNLFDTPFTQEELEKLRQELSLSERRRVMLDPIITYGATLITVLVTDSLILYLQIGDGDILTVSEAGDVKRPHLPADERLFADETTSLCAPDAWRDFRAYSQVLTDTPPALILVSTDGYGNSFRDESGFVKVGADFLNAIRLDGLGKVNEKMEGWLNDASREGSGDDVTLGIICRMDAVDRPLPSGRVPTDCVLQSQRDTNVNVLPDEWSTRDKGHSGRKQTSFLSSQHPEGRVDAIYPRHLEGPDVKMLAFHHLPPTY